MPTLSVDGSHAVLAYWIYQPGVEGADQICDLASAVNFKLMRDLCGPARSPDEVLFAHRQPEDLTPFRRFFRAPLRFDADQTALVFAATWLSQPVAGADAHLRTILEAHLASIENLDGIPIVETLRRVLRALIMTGRGDEGHAAEMLSLHRRTLNRRLQASGTTFHAIAEEMRYDIARQLLRDTGMPVGQIATTLGYADSSAFGRAFRRWSGTTPARWRTVGPDQDPESGRARVC